MPVTSYPVNSRCRLPRFNALASFIYYLSSLFLAVRVLLKVASRPLEDSYMSSLLVLDMLVFRVFGGQRSGLKEVVTSHTEILGT